MLYPNLLNLTSATRLASCSAVALLMMSIPGLSHSFQQAPEMSLQAPPPPPAAVSLNLKQAKKSFFLRKPSMLNGLASWYGSVLDGHKTASGEIFDMAQMTACHRTLPFGTMVRVVDVRSGKSVIVRINDRGVLLANRVIDLSVGAAERLGIKAAGVANVRLEVLGKKRAGEEVASARTPAEATSSLQ